MKKYEPIDISGDAGLNIYGKTLEELFAYAAEGMFHLVTNVSEIHITDEREIIVDSDSYENLLVQWLNELVFLFDTYGFIGKMFTITIEGTTLKARASGGIFDPASNESRLLIKAATYHNLSLHKIDDHWKATVIFDI